MKKITFLFVLLTVSLGYSQQVVLEDFEGTAPSTDLFDGFTSALVEADPVNAAEQSLELITSAAGNPWQGAKLTIQNTTIDMTTADKTMTVDVYSNTPVDFLFKLVDGEVGGLDNNQESKTASSHTGSGWETLTLDFNIGADTGQPGYNPPNDRFGGIVFFPLYIAPNDGWNPAAITTTYVDNITGISGGIVETCNDGILNNGETAIDCGGLNCDACPSPPTEAAETPGPRNTAGVRSIFSDAYTDILGVNWNPGFGASNVAVTDLNVNSDNIKVAAFPGFIAADFPANRFDATDMTMFHIDFWSNDVDLDGKVFNIKIVNFGPTGSSELNALQYDINSATNPPIASGQWVSVDVPLSAFIGVPQGGNPPNAKDGIAQFLVTSNMDVTYFDNVYLYNSALSTDEFASTDFRVYPNPTKNNWNIKSNTTISTVTVYDILGKQVATLAPNASDVEISTANITSGIYFARIESTNGSKTVKLIKE
jgi:hypothetical protein